MIRFALLGAGFIGTVHAANLAAHPEIDVAVVYDVDTTRASSVARTCGARAVPDIEDALDPERIDAVLIASSTDTRAGHLRHAADRGIAVLCEKPIDLDLETAVDAVEHVAPTGITAMVDFNRRFDRDYAELKRIVDTGEVGSVELITMTTRGPALPPLEYIAVSGGQMRDQTVHFFDLARWISGLEPVSVFAAGSVFTDPRMNDLGDVDTSVVTLRLPGGAMVQIDSARRIGYGYDERIEVLGSTGMAEARRHHSGAVVRYHAGQIISDGMHAGWFERVEKSYRSALDHFVDAYLGRGEIGPTLSEGIKAQAIAEAATRSLSTGHLETIHYPVGAPVA